jgi:hypothetical protein
LEHPLEQRLDHRRAARKAVAQQRQQAELREYAARPHATPPASMGSLADQLRDALNNGQRG